MSPPFQKSPVEGMIGSSVRHVSAFSMFYCGICIEKRDNFVRLSCRGNCHAQLGPLNR